LKEGGEEEGRGRKEEEAKEDTPNISLIMGYR